MLARRNQNVSWCRESGICADPHQKSATRLAADGHQTVQFWTLWRLQKYILENCYDPVYFGLPACFGGLGDVPVALQNKYF